jgi:dTDP-4-dehydrorhamnose reductase
MLTDYRPTHVIHLASLSQPTEAERDPEGFFALTVDATRQLATYIRDEGGWMFYPSSDFVLQGNGAGLHDEDAPVRADSIYARGKLDGERAVMGCGAGCVGRLSLLWGMTADETRWGQLVARLIAGQEVYGITDEFRTPLMFAEAARIILALARVRAPPGRGYRGRINIGGSRVLTPFDLICHLRDKVAPDTVVLPVKRSEYSPAVQRPENSALDVSLLNRVLAFSTPRSTRS